jgi:hypothetical protein
MPLTHQHRKQIVALYCCIFYVLMLFKWSAGLFLYQVQPFVFNTRFDLLTWLLMQTGLHQSLISNPNVRIVFDAGFYSMPLLYWLAFKRNEKISVVLAALMLLVNWVYLQCYTLYPTNSIESYTAWLLFPFLFMTINLRSFYFVLHSLRYFFLFLFASAGIWKFVQQGILHIDQMSGVLLFQHKEHLVSAPGYWFSNMIYWLINHSTVSYLLYLGGALLELFFLVGFFTRKFDKWLIVGFILFIVVDLLLMRIYYWELSPFLLTLVYSRFKLPAPGKLP